MSPVEAEIKALVLTLGGLRGWYRFGACLIKTDVGELPATSTPMDVIKSLRLAIDQERGIEGKDGKDAEQNHTGSDGNPTVAPERTKSE